MDSVLSRNSADGKYVLSNLTSDRLQDALAVMREAFFKDENVSIATEVAQNPEAMGELEELCVRAAADGVSVIAIEKASNKLVAVAFNKIQVASNEREQNYFEQFEEKCKHPSSKALVRYMIDMEARFNIFKIKRANCALEIMFIATLRDYRGSHLASQLWALSMEISRHLRQGKNVKVPIDGKKLLLEPIPELVMSLATSNATYKIAKNFEFEVLLEVGFDQFSYQGKSFAARIGPNTPSSAFVCFCLD